MWLAAVCAGREPAVVGDNEDFDPTPSQSGAERKWDPDNGFFDFLNTERAPGFLAFPLVRRWLRNCIPALVGRHHPRVRARVALVGLEALLRAGLPSWPRA